jgi:hypothetical protein
MRQDGSSPTVAQTVPGNNIVSAPYDCYATLYIGQLVSKSALARGEMQVQDR